MLKGVSELAVDNQSSAYDLRVFDSAMPQKRQQPIQNPRIVRKKPKTKQQLRREAIASALNTMKIFVVAIVLFSMFGGILYSRVSLTLLERDAENIKTELAAAQSENVRLTMELDSLVSDKTVDEYAVGVLGMQKLERYQIHYFENKDSDKAFVRDGSDSAD